MKSLRWNKHRVDGRAGWQLENGRMRLELLEGGGHIASIQLLGSDPPAGLNPLWTPPWPGIEPYRFSMAKNGPAYGSNSESQLLSGIRGHNVCFDYWGAPSPDEMNAGMSFHGEAGIIRWTLGEARVTRSQLKFSYAANMTRSAAHFRRTVTLREGEPVAYFEETAENMLALDRQVGWVEHITIGPPFLQRGRTLLDASLTRGYSLPGALGRVPPEAEFEWPFLKTISASGEENTVDLRVAAPERRSGFVLSALVAPSREFGFVAASTPAARLLMAYVFRRGDFPWINVWEQNRHATIAPWKGRTLAVGLEFGNTVVPGSRHAMAAFPPEKHAVPTYGWLAARASKTARYIALLAEVPRTFHGIADVQVASNGVKIIERETQAEIEVPCDGAFLSEK